MKKQSNGGQTLSGTEKITRIFEMLLGGSLSDGMRQKVLAWYVSGDGREEKDEILGHFFAMEINEERPDQWAREHCLRAIRQLGFDHEVIEELEREIESNRKTRPLRRQLLVRVAAVLLPVAIVLGVGTLLMTREPAEQPFAHEITVTADNAVSRLAVLPDSSKVWLAHGSTISYDAGFREDRRVVLNGEAYFSVRKMNGAPFRVRSANLAVEVLGTEFNIIDRAGEAVSQVALASGSVEVTAARNRKVVIEPGQQLVKRNGTRDFRIETTAAESISDWTVTDLAFTDTPAEEVLRKVGLYYGKNVVVEQGALPNELLSMSFTSNVTLEHILRVMNNITSGFGYEITDETIIITKKR